jgi:LytS/YehU family sensor histidine kinase
MGFILGNVGAQVLVDLLPAPWQHALTTFLVTEILGWSLYIFAHRIFPYGAAGYERDQSWYDNAGWLVTAIALVFGIRLYIGHFYTGNLMLENSGALMVLILTTLLALLFMVNSAIQMRREVSAQRTRRHQAEFSYMTLKHQVNPHFLFNCLNVLDSLVQDGTREEASDYIQKMATLYRYLMNQEGKRLVPLSDEFEFSRTYRELMQIRYPEGLVFEDRISTQQPIGYIVPCTLQLLVENAIKHNTISAQKPLVITGTTDGESLTFSNNRIPKLTPVRSTGIGLQYIRNQYRDIAGLEIQVVETNDSFSVTIPIIRQSEDFFVPLNRKHKQV